MEVKGVRLVLGQHADLHVAGIDKVGKNEINEAVGSPKGHCRLGAVRSEREKALTLTTCEDNC